MSFSGKRYRRVRCENIDAILKAENTSESMIRILNCNAPIFSFTKIDDTKMKFVLDIEGKVFEHSFTLGQEHDMERRDGTKVRLTYTLEGDSILNQTIKMPDGRVSHFRREFTEKETKMIINFPGVDAQAVIYYEVVE